MCAHTHTQTRITARAHTHAQANEQKAEDGTALRGLTFKVNLKRQKPEAERVKGLRERGGEKENGGRERGREGGRDTERG